MSRLARCFECSKQGILLPGTMIQDSIDEERWGTLHPATFATLQILLDTGQRVLFCQSTCELLHLQTNRLGKAGQTRVLKGMLMMETPSRVDQPTLSTARQCSGKRKFNLVKITPAPILSRLMGMTEISTVSLYP